MKNTIWVLAAAAFALGGCTTVDQYGASSRQNVVDAQGNVAGYKQLLRNERTGEVAAQVRMYTPIRNEVGDLVGYEEQTQDGAIIRDLDGRQVGARFQDMRSRGTNTRSKGITVIIGSLYSRPVVAEPEMPIASRLVASLSARDLRAIR
jgi:hypothetical protein